MLSPTFFINVFYLVLFCIHVCVDDVIEKKNIFLYDAKKPHDCLIYIIKLVKSKANKLIKQSTLKTELFKMIKTVSKTKTDT